MINKKQLYLLVLLGLILTTTSNAQLNIGVDAGITYHQLQFESNNKDIRLSKRRGYIVNINIDQTLNKGFAVVVSPGVIQKNYAIENKYNVYQNINNAYLHFPVSLKYELKLFKRLNLSVDLGLYYAYWLESNISGIAPNVFNISNNSEGGELIQLEAINLSYKFNPQQDNRSEFGWLAKIGLNYSVLKNTSCLITWHHYQSMTNQQKQGNEFQYPKYNQTVATTIGLAYHLK